MVVYEATQLGPVTTATYDIYDRAGAALAAGLSATLPPSTQLAPGGATAGDGTIDVVDATDIEVGESYLLLATDGAHEYVTVQRISGSTLTLLDALPDTYNSLSTLSGAVIACPIAAAYTGTLGDGYEVRVTYVVGGLSYTESVYFNIVRSPWPEVILRPHEFGTYAGALSATELERITGAQFGAELADATELVRLEVQARGYRPDLFRDTGAFKRPIAYRVIYEWARQGANVPRAWQSDPASWVEEARGRYEQAMSQALDTAETYDADQDGVVTEAEAQRSLASRRILI